MDVAVAMGLVSEARSKMVSVRMAAWQGSMIALPKALW